MKKEDVLKCSFSSWYPTFEDVTIKSRILPLTDDFVQYLLADGIVLPETNTVETETEDHKCSDNSDDIDWDSDQGAVAPSFPEFETRLRQSIKELGGKVFPKLNWSAPKDATWMSFDRTLKCVCSSDIYLLLKSSEFVTHDLTEPFSQCEDYTQGEKNDVKYELALRKWCDLNPGMEFRCFVFNNKLLAISQRDVSQYFHFIAEMKSDIISGIKSFFHHVIDGNFCSSYVFDVYKRDNGTFWVLDFNPYGSVTDPLMFTWGELNNLTNQGAACCVIALPAFRCIETQTGIGSSSYTSNAVPRELADLSSQDDFNRLMTMMESMPVGGCDTDSQTDTDEDMSDIGISDEKSTPMLD